jgi:hypothetical protein
MAVHHSVPRYEAHPRRIRRTWASKIWCTLMPMKAPAEDHLCQEHDWIGTQALRQGCHTDGRAVGIGVIGVDLFGQT